MPVLVLCGLTLPCVTIREEQKRNLLEYVEMPKIFGPRTEEVAGNFKKLHNESFMIFVPRELLLGQFNQGPGLEGTGGKT